jgi:surface protein
MLNYSLRWSFDSDEWEQLIYDELNEGRPVQYNATHLSGSGHAFVLDGYENGYFHANWGWGGTESYISMYSTEGRFGYDSFDDAIIGIQPAYPENPIRYATLDNGIMTLYYDKEKTSRSGTVLPYKADWANYKEEITECVIDPSFANYRPRNLSAFFAGWKNLKSIKGLEYLNTENVTSMNQMFSGCDKLSSLDVSGFKTDRVKDMWSMFRGCSNLTSLNVSGFNTDHVMYLSDMFNGCSNLTSLDVSSFNTGKVTDMNYMFCGCSNLTTIYASNLWDNSNVTTSNDMFYDCGKLVGGAGTTFDWGHVSGEYARIDGGTSNPGYFTYKESSGIATPLSFSESLSDMHNLSGAKVRSARQDTNGLPSGLYIFNKKKVLVK